MKKVINHIVSLLFAGGLLIFTVGVPVNDHYCADSFISTTIGLPFSDPCGDMPMAGDCCDDETTLFSVTDYLSNTNISFFNSIAPVMLVCNYTECTQIVPQLVESDLVAEHYPPPIESRIFMEIQSFLL